MRTRKMKQWPANDEPASAGDLIKEVKKAIRFAYKLKRKKLGRDIPLAGPDAPGGACVGEGSEMLRAEHLKFAQEDQGRNALDEILGIAIRLGIEQGRRIMLKSDSQRYLNFRLKILRENMRTIKEHAHDPEMVKRLASQDL
ncbi:MAG: hypothetical protein HY226_00340 [Candidatus Vogelbacteria bacterium]|nr:hypothetical protein [Candidatus Vogelbacteria bacterium]